MSEGEEGLGCVLGSWIPLCEVESGMAGMSFFGDGIVVYAHMVLAWWSCAILEQDILSSTKGVESISVGFNPGARVTADLAGSTYLRNALFIPFTLITERLNAFTSFPRTHASFLLMSTRSTIGCQRAMT